MNKKRVYQSPDLFVEALIPLNLLDTMSFPGTASGDFGSSEDVVDSDWEEVP